MYKCCVKSTLNTWLNSLFSVSSSSHWSYDQQHSLTCSLCTSLNCRPACTHLILTTTHPPLNLQETKPSPSSQQQPAAASSQQTGPVLRWTNGRFDSEQKPAERNHYNTHFALRTAHLLRQVCGKCQTEQHHPHPRRRPGCSAGGDGELTLPEDTCTITCAVC